MKWKLITKHVKVTIGIRLFILIEVGERYTFNPVIEEPSFKLKSYECQGQITDNWPSISSISPKSNGPPKRIKEKYSWSSLKCGPN